MLLLQVEGTTIGFGRMVAGLPASDLPSTPLAHNVGAGQVGKSEIPKSPLTTNPNVGPGHWKLFSKDREALLQRSKVQN